MKNWSGLAQEDVMPANICVETVLRVPLPLSPFPFPFTYFSSSPSSFRGTPWPGTSMLGEDVET